MAALIRLVIILFKLTVKLLLAALDLIVSQNLREKGCMQYLTQSLKK